MPWNAMIPWNSNGIYLLGLFGIPTLAYAKYFVFAYVILAVVIVMCAFGWNLEKESVGDAE
jgi:NhaC family Na+:H+ antiporter